MQSLVLLFAAGFLVASGAPVDQQVATTTPDTNDSQTVNVQTISNKDVLEQSDETTNMPVEIKETDNVVVEEVLDIPLDLIPPEEGTFYLSDVPDATMVDRNSLYRNALVNLEEELLETARSSSIAAGFSLRKRNKKRKQQQQQPSRRRKNPHFRRNPFSHRRLSYPYYYPYYYRAFYRPNSLRYY